MIALRHVGQAERQRTRLIKRGHRGGVVAGWWRRMPRGARDIETTAR